MKKQTLIGQTTNEQIAEWKQMHKQGIYAITTGGHIAYFKNPTRHEVNCTLSKADAQSVLTMYEELAELTFIGGSRAVIDDDTLFLGYTQQVKTKLEGEKAELVNL